MEHPRAAVRRTTPHSQENACPRQRDRVSTNTRPRVHDDETDDSFDQAPAVRVVLSRCCCSFVAGPAVVLSGLALILEPQTALTTACGTPGCVRVVAGGGGGRRPRPLSPPLPASCLLCSHPLSAIHPGSSSREYPDPTPRARARRARALRSARALRNALRNARALCERETRRRPSTRRPRRAKRARSANANSGRGGGRHPRATLSRDPILRPTSVVSPIPTLRLSAVGLAGASNRGTESSHDGGVRHDRRVVTIGTQSSNASAERVRQQTPFDGTSHATLI